MGFNLEDYEPVAIRLARWLTQTEGHGRVVTHLVHYQELASCRVTFLVTPAQRAALFASAKELGVPVGEYVRDRLGF